MSTNALSGHGTLIKRRQSGTYVTIAELGDMTPPGLSRNEFDATTQQEDIDSYVLGVLRRTPVTFSMNFIPSNSTHDHLTGLYKAVISNSMDGYQFTTPGGFDMIASGQVQNIVPQAPVDGKLSAQVTLRFSGAFIINGVLVGA